MSSYIYELIYEAFSGKVKMVQFFHVFFISLTIVVKMFWKNIYFCRGNQSGCPPDSPPYLILEQEHKNPEQ